MSFDEVANCMEIYSEDLDSSIIIFPESFSYIKDEEICKCSLNDCGVPLKVFNKFNILSTYLSYYVCKNHEETAQIILNRLTIFEIKDILDKLGIKSN